MQQIYPTKSKKATWGVYPAEVEGKNGFHDEFDKFNWPQVVDGKKKKLAEQINLFQKSE